MDRMASSRSPAGKGHGQAPEASFLARSISVARPPYLQVKENPSGGASLLLMENLDAMNRWHTVHWGTPSALMELIKTISDRSVAESSNALEEPFVTFLIVSRHSVRRAAATSSESYDTRLQEQFLIEDLLGVLLGFPGHIPQMTIIMMMMIMMMMMPQ